MAKDLLYQYVLALGDDFLILGQRLSQWAYKGPFLEEDIALSNISLDMFGRANLLLEYAASLKENGTTNETVLGLGGVASPEGDESETSMISPAIEEIETGWPFATGGVLGSVNENTPRMSEPMPVR